MDALEDEITAEAADLQAAALQRLQFTLLAAAITSVVLSIIIGTWIVLKASRMMNDSASTIASSASEIAASIEQQERTSSQQAASVSETTTTMDELGASSRQSAEQAEAAAAGAQQALSLAESGARAVERSLDGMNALREKVDAIADQILRLSEANQPDRRHFRPGKRPGQPDQYAGPQRCCRGCTSWGTWQGLCGGLR